jgi:translation initiation factor 2B subunit (eIF-2B alpha/beta/delta family)
MMSNKGGWADQEMRQTLKNMASLIELEIKKFEAVYMIVMESEPSVELDAEIMTRKLLDRGIPCYDGEK